MSTWTYSGDPASSDHDQLRFNIGDTNENDPLLSDAEIDFCVAQGGPSYSGMALAAEAVAMRYGREADIRISPLSIDYNNRAKFWSMRADEYRKRSQQLGVPTFSISSFQDPNGRPYFWLGMHDIGTGPAAPPEAAPSV